MLCENCGTRVSESDINCPVCGAKIERETIKKTTVSKNLNIDGTSNSKRKVAIISSIAVVLLVVVISAIVLISNQENKRVDSNLPESNSAQFSSSPKVIRAQTLNGTELGVSNVDSSRTFKANNTIDDNYDTCWCVNTDSTGGVGAEIAFILEEQTTIRRVGIINGNQFHTYDELYSLNGQVCEFMLTFSDGSTQTFHADFNSGNPENYQYFDVEPSVVTGSVVLTVISAYEGTKYSTNVAITEFEVY